MDITKSYSFHLISCLRLWPFRPKCIYFIMFWLCWRLLTCCAEIVCVIVIIHGIGLCWRSSVLIVLFLIQFRLSKLILYSLREDSIVNVNLSYIHSFICRFIFSLSMRLLRFLRWCLWLLIYGRMLIIIHYKWAFIVGQYLILHCTELIIFLAYFDTVESLVLNRHIFAGALRLYNFSLSFVRD